MPLESDAISLALKPTSILDLPTEILDSIFSLFWESLPYYDGSSPSLFNDLGYIDWRCIEDSLVRGQGLHSIQNLRLVCHRFNFIASPILFPVIFVDLSQTSVDRFDAISRNPAIADGVRGIQLRLQYNIPDLAADLALFGERCSILLKHIDRVADYNSEGYFIQELCSMADTQNAKEYRMLQDLSLNCWFIRNAWGEFRNAWGELVNGLPPSPKRRHHVYRCPQHNDDDHDGHNIYEPQVTVQAPEQQQLLLQAYEQYQKVSAEQSRLLEDGSFVKSLAAAMARMPRATCLHLGDNAPTVPESIYNYKCLETVLEPDLFLRRLVAPAHWTQVESVTAERGTKLLPVSVLSEIPIALQQAGAQVRNISLGCFPNQLPNLHFLRPRQFMCGDLDPWKALNLACASLESFRVIYGDTYCQGSSPRSEDMISDESKTYLDNYLGAMLCGQSLEEVKRLMHRFSFDFNPPTPSRTSIWDF
ncbi:hypothetical protein ACHAQA_008696 [Verticillium albo-atrum]